MLEKLSLSKTGAVEPRGGPNLRQTWSSWTYMYMSKQANKHVKQISTAVWEDYLVR